MAPQKWLQFLCLTSISKQVYISDQIYQQVGNTGAVFCDKNDNKLLNNVKIDLQSLKKIMI